MRTLNLLTKSPDGLSGPLRTRKYRRAFTLVEMVIAMLILLIGGIAVVSGIIYTRQAMELNKQKMTAMNIARHVLESASTNSSLDGISEQVIMKFNEPGLTVPATVQLNYYSLDSNGNVLWGTPRLGPAAGEPTYARCVVSWDSMGSTGRRHSVTLSTIVRAGTL